MASTLRKPLALLSGLIGFPLSLITPKDRSLWLFGSWFGEKFSDNSRFLFEVASRRGVSAVWISRDRSVVSMVRSLGFRAEYAFSIRGLALQMRAGTFVCTVNAFDFVPWTLTPRSRIIQLWHGTPLKHIQFEVWRRWSPSWVTWQVRRWTTDRYSYVISPDALTDAALTKAFKLKASQLLRAPYPRWDALQIPESQRVRIRERYGATDRTLVTVLLTHRQEGRGDNVVTRDAFSALRRQEEKLASLGCTVVFRPHFYEHHKFRSTASGTQVILDMEADVDTTSLLAVTDILVTDYSSVMFDFAPTKRPILLYQPDLQAYESTDRALRHQWHELSDSVATTIEDLLQLISRAIAGEPPISKIPPQPYIAGGNAARVLDLLQRSPDAGRE